MAAAPNAANTAVVNVTPSNDCVGASINPATTANTVPMIHAHRRTRTGSSPLMDTSSWLSTTPRITTPRRTDWKNQYSTAAATTREHKQNDLLPSDVYPQHPHRRLRQEMRRTSAGSSGATTTPTPRR